MDSEPSRLPRTSRIYREREEQSRAWTRRARRGPSTQRRLYRRARHHPGRRSLRLSADDHAFPWLTIMRSGLSSPLALTICSASLQYHSHQQRKRASPLIWQRVMKVLLSRIQHRECIAEEDVVCEDERGVCGGSDCVLNHDNVDVFSQR
jgi:hypothetical protein